MLSLIQESFAFMLFQSESTSEETAAQLASKHAALVKTVYELTDKLNEVDTNVSEVAKGGRCT